MGLLRTDGRRRRHVPAALLLAVVALGAWTATAAANTHTWSGTISLTDPSSSFIFFDNPGPTTCGSTVNQQGANFTLHYDVYAFRNLAPATDCITVSGVNCQTFDFSFFVGPPSAFAGSDGTTSGSCDSAGNHAHSFNVASNQDIVTFVAGQLSDSTPIPYGLSVSGTNVAPINLVSLSNAALPGNNQMTVSASALQDGTSPQGSVQITGQPNHVISGPVRCLRVDGNNASLEITYDNQTVGQPAKFAGQVIWLHQSTGSGDSDGQRNASLTQAQLNRGKYATCPDPNAPLQGSYAPLSSGGMLVVQDPPETQGT